MKILSTLFKEGSTLTSSAVYKRAICTNTIFTTFFNIKKCVFVLFLFMLHSSISAQISGTVFRDYNLDGVKNNSAVYNEPFEAGINVKATLPSGVSFTTTTNIAGSFSFTAIQIPTGTKVRLEFYGLKAGDFSSLSGAAGNTDVQFVTAPNALITYGINAPDDYWDNVTTPNPSLMVVNSRRGTPNSAYAGQYSLLEINNNSSGPVSPPNSEIVNIDTSKHVTLHSQTGSVCGMTVQNKQQRIFLSSILKRASGFGPQGAGGIYMASKSGAKWNFTGGFTLQGVTPSNGGAALDFGSVTRVTSPATDDNFISDDVTWNVPSGSDSRDIDAFVKAGTMSFGDIEADISSDKVFMMNLFQKRLIVFNATAASATLNGATAASLAPYTQAYGITSLPGCPLPTGAGNTIRPFGIKIYKGKGYLGVVSDAMATQNENDLIGYILEFDLQNIAAGFTTVLTINFVNYKDRWGSSYWRPWINSWLQTGGNTNSGPDAYPQPMISNIEFNEEGSMDIGIRDRWGDQGATFEFIPLPGATGHEQTILMGDILHACKTTTGWAVEGTPGSCVQPAANILANAAGNKFGYGFSYGNTGREWYADRSGDGSAESVEGTLTKLMGTGIIVSSVYDPYDPIDNIGPKFWSTHGIQWNEVTTGVKTQIARIQGSNSVSVDKANGIGDIEFLLPPAPVQIGNRIWFDANANGFQDADEDTPGVPAGTVVTLLSPGIDGIYGNGDDQSWTTTTNATGNYFFSTLSSSDNRKPATWTGVGNVILPGYAYRVRVPIPTGYNLTFIDQGGTPSDNIDNDAYKSTGNIATIDISAANTNHSYDIGLQNLMILPDEKLVLQARIKDKQATLQWKTTGETNSSYFVAERSRNGMQFTTTGNTITAAGNTNSENKYTCTDDINNFDTENLIYYRIKLVNANGSFKYSNTAIINTNMNTDVKIWPNPLATELNVTVSIKKISIITLKIIDASGRLIKTQDHQVYPGINTITVPNLYKIPEGVFTVEIINNTEKTRKVYKLMKL